MPQTRTLERTGSPLGNPISFKPTAEDREILHWLKKKLGGNTTGIIRQALRTLRDKEKA